LLGRLFALLGIGHDANTLSAADFPLVAGGFTTALHLITHCSLL